MGAAGVALRVVGLVVAVVTVAILPVGFGFCFFGGPDPGEYSPFACKSDNNKFYAIAFGGLTTITGHITATKAKESAHGTGKIDKWIREDGIHRSGGDGVYEDTHLTGDRFFWEIGVALGLIVLYGAICVGGLIWTSNEGGLRTAAAVRSLAAFVAVWLCWSGCQTTHLTSDAYTAFVVFSWLAAFFILWIAVVVALLDWLILVFLSTPPPPPIESPLCPPPRPGAPAAAVPPVSTPQKSPPPADLLPAAVRKPAAEPAASSETGTRTTPERTAGSTPEPTLDGDNPTLDGDKPTLEAEKPTPFEQKLVLPRPPAPYPPPLPPTNPPPPPPIPAAKANKGLYPVQPGYMAPQPAPQIPKP